MSPTQRKHSKAGLERMKNTTEQQEQKFNEMLSYALDYEDVDLVRDAIRQGANVNTVTQCDGEFEDTVETPLCRAVVTDDEEIVHEILKAGANPNALSEDGSPLHYCFDSCIGMCPEIAKLLLDAGADPNLDCGIGFTPLYQAAYWDQSCIPDLLAHGGNPHLLFQERHATILECWAQDGCWKSLAAWIVFNHPELKEELEAISATVKKEVIKRDENDERVQLFERIQKLDSNDPSFPFNTQFNKEDFDEDDFDEDDFSMNSFCDLLSEEDVYSPKELTEYITLPYLKFCFEHVDFENPEGWEKFMLLGTLKNQKLDEAQLLLDSGKFDVNLATTDTNDTALHICSQEKSLLPLMVQLLKMGANPESLK